MICPEDRQKKLSSRHRPDVWKLDMVQKRFRTSPLRQSEPTLSKPGIPRTTSSETHIPAKAILNPFSASDCQISPNLNLSRRRLQKSGGKRKFSGDTGEFPGKKPASNLQLTSSGLSLQQSLRRSSEDHVHEASYE